jgi:uncharacterized protein (TIGR02271 family)
MQGVSVHRDDGAHGTVVAIEEPGKVVIEFSDGSRLVISTEKLTLQQDGSYFVPLTANFGGAVGEHKLTIPVIAEELKVDTLRVARGKVRINKRIETRQELVDASVIREEVVVEHVPVNQFIEETVPEAREEGGVLIIPVIEEVLVTEKRLLLREEIRVFKRRTTTSTPQTIELRREVIDIEREELNSSDLLRNL